MIATDNTYVAIVSKFDGQDSSSISQSIGRNRPTMWVFGLSGCREFDTMAAWETILSLRNKKLLI